MMGRPSMLPVVSKKRKPLTGREGADGRTTSVCNFCAKTPAALFIHLPVLGRKKRSATPYCLMCYYTTSAVRQDPEKYVTIVDKEEQKKQLPAIQHLFSECFIELQQELAEESARSFKKQKNDPLAMLSFSSASGSSSSLFASKKRRKLVANKGQAPDPRKKKEGNANDGGFLRDIGLPERLKRTQKEQEQLQNQQLARMNQAASAARRASRTTNIATPTAASIYKRRKGSGKSIWNLAMDKSQDGKLSTGAESSKSTDGKSSETNIFALEVQCTCGSKDVRSFGNITSRNQEVRKAEIWGTGRGEDVINRYQCNTCGKTWNEVE